MNIKILGNILHFYFIVIENEVFKLQNIPRIHISSLNYGSCTLTVSFLHIRANCKYSKSRILFSFKAPETGFYYQNRCILPPPPPPGGEFSSFPVNSTPTRKSTLFQLKLL